MESTIRYTDKPELNRPILIEGLPGVGNVGKIVADFIAQKLEAKHFASVISKYLPPQVLVNQDNVGVMASNELFYAKDVGESHLDVIFLLGDFQAVTPEGQFKLCEDMMNEIFLKYDVSTIFTLGGYGTGQMVKEPRVIGVASDLEMKEKMQPYGIEFPAGEPAAGIVGASGIFLGLGQFHGIESGCIMGETSGYFVDYRSGLRVLTVLEKILGIELDRTEMEEKCHHIEELEGKVLEYQASQNKENLGYFG